MRHSPEVALIANSPKQREPSHICRSRTAQRFFTCWEIIFTISLIFFTVSKEKFITKFVTRITNFVTHIRKFVTLVTKFLIKIICAERKNYLRREEKLSAQRGKTFKEIAKNISENALRFSEAGQCIKELIVSPNSGLPRERSTRCGGHGGRATSGAPVRCA